MNNTDNGNVRIARFEEHFAVSWTDPRNGLRATHTTFPIPFPEDVPETDCGPQVDLDPLDVQDVGEFIDSEEFFRSWLHRNEKGSLWVIIRDVNQVGDCYGNKLIAEGPGEMHYTDNDLFGFVEGETHANAWGFGARGTLTTPDGRTVHYSGHLRTVALPEIVHEDAVVNLH